MIGSTATADVTVTASAANKTWIFKRNMAVVSRKHYRNASGSLAVVNDPKPVGVS